MARTRRTARKGRRATDLNLFNRIGQAVGSINLQGASICWLPKDATKQKEIPAVKAVRLDGQLWVVESAAWSLDGHGKAILRRLLAQRTVAVELILGSRGDPDREPWTGCRVKVGQKQMVIGPVEESRSVTF